MKAELDAFTVLHICGGLCVTGCYYADEADMNVFSLKVCSIWCERDKPSVCLRCRILGLLKARCSTRLTKQPQ